MRDPYIGLRLLATDETMALLGDERLDITCCLESTELDQKNEHAWYYLSYSVTDKRRDGQTDIPASTTGVTTSRIEIQLSALK